MTILLAKRVLKRAAGFASIALRPVAAPAQQAGACILMYHRVSAHRVVDARIDDWNVDPQLFESHLAMLAEQTEILFVSELAARLASQGPASKPIACLTFDDGYANFHEQALPLLRRYGVKATVFVVTGYVGSRRPMPFDRWGCRHAGGTGSEAWRPMNWTEIESSIRSGLVEVGAHSHRHGNAYECTTAEVRDEAERSRAVLRARLGEAHARTYAYPYGCARIGQITADYIQAVRTSGYQSAVATDTGLVVRTSDRFALPRVEVYRSDNARVVRAKVAGSLLPYALTERLRRAHR